MLLYTMSDPNSFKKVSLGSIKFLAKQLNDFVETYEKKVLIQTPEDRRAFNRLKMISKLLNEEQYGMLITNPYLYIDFEDDNDEYIPHYFPYY